MRRSHFRRMRLVRTTGKNLICHLLTDYPLSIYLSLIFFCKIASETQHKKWEGKLEGQSDAVFLWTGSYFRNWCGFFIWSGSEDRIRFLLFFRSKPVFPTLGPARWNGYKPPNRNSPPHSSLLLILTLSSPPNPNTLLFLSLYLIRYATTLLTLFSEQFGPATTLTPPL